MIDGIVHLVIASNIPQEYSHWGCSVRVARRTGRFLSAVVARARRYAASVTLQLESRSESKASKTDRLAAGRAVEFVVLPAHPPPSPLIHTLIDFDCGGLREV